MADYGEIQTIINGFPENLRPKMLEFAKAVLKMRFGHPTGTTSSEKLVNFSGAFLHGTTPATPGDEFTIAHDIGRAPYFGLIGLRFDAVGSSVVPLTVSRAADNHRVYLTSTEANAPVTLFAEG